MFGKLVSATEPAPLCVPQGPFKWDPIVQGVLLSGYFYGYLVTQVTDACLT